MKNTLVVSILSVLVTLQVGCAASADDGADEPIRPETVGVEGAGYVRGNAGGTVLNISSEGPSQQCSGSGASVSLAGTIVSSASGTTAIVTATGAFHGTYTIAAGDWKKEKGSYKASWLYTSDYFQNGTYSVTVCATQSGSDGRPSKTTCTDYPFTVECAD